MICWEPTQRTGIQLVLTMFAENFIISSLELGPWTIIGHSQALRDPSLLKGQVKSNTLTCAAHHNGCVPNQIAGKV